MSAVVIVLVAVLLLLCQLDFVGAANNPQSIFTSSSPTGLATSNSGLDIDFHPVKDVKEEEELKTGCITWNLAEKSPSFEDCLFLREFLNCDLIALGIQECENLKFRRKEGSRSRKWRQLTTKIISPNFQRLVSHKLGGMQMSLFVNKRTQALIEGIQTIEIPCGIGNVLSNKGGICVLLRIKGKTFCFINSHLAAHLTKFEQRNADYQRIVNIIAEKAHKKWIYPSPNLINLQKNHKTLKRKVSKSFQKSSSVKMEKKHILAEMFDGVIFFGDLNYRIDLPRLEIETFCEFYATTEKRILPIESTNKAVEDTPTTKKRSILRRKQQKQKSLDIPILPTIIRRNILTNNLTSSADSTLQDQKKPQRSLYYHPENFEKDLRDILRYDQLSLTISMKKAFDDFQEAPISFPPTYKFDKGSSAYDTSSKRRCPAWTDRILYAIHPKYRKSLRNGEAEEALPCPLIEVGEYYSVDVRSSDHRPVCARFSMHIQ